MDGALSNSRQSGSSSNYYGGYNSNNRGRRGRGGRGRGGGGGRRHHPYSRGGQAPRNAGNRFNSTSSTTSVDPQSAMLKQLSAMVAKMGDLISSAQASSACGDNKDQERPVVKVISRNIQDLVHVLCSVKNAPLFLKFDPTSASAEELAGPLATLVTNCAASLPLFTPSYAGLTLGVEGYAPTTGEYAGFAKRCVRMAEQRLGADLDITLGVVCLQHSQEDASSVGHDRSKGIIGLSFGIDAFMRVKFLLRYLTLLGRIGIIKQQHDLDLDEPDYSIDYRVSIAGLLRLLVQAACAAISAARNNDVQHESEEKNKALKHAALILSSLVLSTVPYAMHYLSREFILYLLETLELHVLSQEFYRSAYEPGVGIMALLLQEEQLDHTLEAAEEEEDEEEEDEEDAAPPCADTLQDLLRTIRKVVQSHFQNDTSNNTRFALLTDAPWAGLSARPEEYAPMEGDAEDEMEKRRDEKTELMYDGEEIWIQIPNSCISIPYLLSLGNRGRSNRYGPVDGNGATDASGAVVLQCCSLDGIVFGRLSIFDPPPDASNDNDEEDEYQEDKEKSSEESDPQLDAYVNTFTLVDRYFLSESVRDCLICHRSSVSDSGAEKGTSRDVAEQIWAVSHLFAPASSTRTNHGNGDDAGEDNGNAMDTSNAINAASSVSRGVEYGIIETVLSLIIQAPRGTASASPLSHVYLSRVLMDLTKHQPSLIPRGLVKAVSTLFYDFLPTLVPYARENLSSWLAFHLTNTDYQWPHAYWTHWTPYVVKGMTADEGGENDTTEAITLKRNSRGEFVTRVLQFMMTYVSSLETLVTELLLVQSPLCDFLLGSDRGSGRGGGGLRNLLTAQPSALEEGLTTVEKDLQRRIWKDSDDPDVIREYMVGDEVSEFVQGGMDDDDIAGSLFGMDKIWWRTGLITRTMLLPAHKENKRLLRELEKVQTKADSTRDDTAMTREDEDGSGENGFEDTLMDIGDAMARYRPVMLSALTRDVQVHEENLDLRGVAKKNVEEMTLMGEIYIIRQVEKVASYSAVVLEGCIEALLKNKIVNEMSVLRWALGDDVLEGSSSKGPVEISRIAFGWWNFASMALRVGLAKFLSESLPGGTGFGPDSDIGLIIDVGGEDGDGSGGAGTPSTRRIKNAIAFVVPLVHYAVSSVCRSLYNLGSKNNASNKKMLPLEVDLVEGLKHFARSAHSNLMSALKDDDTLRTVANDTIGGLAVEIANCLARSDLCGAQLASLCRSGNVPHVELLIRSLERL